MFKFNILGINRHLLALGSLTIMSNMVLSTNLSAQELTVTQTANNAVSRSTTDAELVQEIKLLKQRLAALEQKMKQRAEAPTSDNLNSEQPVVVKSNQTAPNTNVEARLEQIEQQLEIESDNHETWPIKIHGAVRFQYVYEDYNPDNENRTGDFDFDIFRLNFDGEIGDVILSAEYRWYQYQEAVKHAYFGYNFDEYWQAQVGVIAVPFGNLPYNSHSYFFNSTFYVGLEDEHDSGIKVRYRSDTWDLDAAFLKSDEQGGIDGFVSDRTARYSYDTVGIRLAGEGIYDEPVLAIGESNSWALRGAHTWSWSTDETLELGLSAQGGNLYSGSIEPANAMAQFANQNLGNRLALAAHGVYDHGPWNVQVQLADYDYDLKVDHQGVVMAAYSFYDTIPSEARIYTANVAYTLPVSAGPLTSLTFYNDHSVITDKRDLNNDTWMNVLGVAVAAGNGFYTYFDFVRAKNQPFIGGSIADDNGEVNNRFNINFGYYF
ncbi:porin family protein [Flocculibacter collagenilyticus]|uniref:porin n=1 Tax=Flocculibacter collagenilyticus TaxID=2744479 RepID=UPI0018F3A0CF|nr:porin [Flocculibacter collagenilyticus]